ncbi:hypothetical protein HGI30_14740 [Paenibacillus albicereus]|uniref:Uncharacterized protein n=1 Tax=Paenibacillus albicereus TaxID=2726185 RepID=A0A6H2GZ64_9BACL|nr:hypothetical protein [Paenibacillus albicereus]QJC52695.1 hypothetical protein HGI30_14740 [Paenibacillus albicereus]
MADKQPRVEAFSAKDASGADWSFTVSSDIIDHYEQARVFGPEALADPAEVGRYQRRVLSLPDHRGGAVLPMLLSIGTDGELFLARRDLESPDGWQSVELTPGRTGSGAPRVQAIGAAWTEDDRIALTVATEEPGGTGASRIWTAFGLSSAATAWETLAWTDGGTREGRRVEAIRVLDEGDGSWTAVLAGHGGAGDLLYLLRSGGAASFADALVFNPATTLDEIYDFEAGVHPTYGPGLYVLGTGSGTDSLAFRPFPDYDDSGHAATVPPVVPLPCPAGARLLETGLTGTDGTDLYVGGSGVSLLTADEQDNAEQAAVTAVVAPEAAPALADLCLADRPSAGGKATSVWCLLQDGGLLTAAQDAGGGWLAPLLVRTGVLEMAPAMGDGSLRSSVLAVYAGGGAGLIAQAADGRSWQETELRVQDPAAMIASACYAVTLRVVEPSTGEPRPGVAVQVEASAPTNILLGSRPAFIGPGASAQAVTGLDGGIALYSRVQSLAPPSYRLTVDGLDGHLDLQPAAAALERFAGLTGAELRSATVAMPGGEQPLLPDAWRSGSGADQADAVADALRQGAQLAAGPSGSSWTIRRSAAGDPYRSAIAASSVPDGYRWGIVADGRGGVRAADDSVIGRLVQAAESAESFFVQLGHTVADFFEGLAHRAEEAWTFVLHKAEDALHFVCELGGKIKRFALSCLEEAAGFFRWLWQQVETGLDKVWQFLKFLFSWEDVLIVRDAMKEAVDDALGYVRSRVAALKPTVESGFRSAMLALDSWRPEGGAAFQPSPPAPGESLQDKLEGAASPVREFIDAITGNSVVSWVRRKLDDAVGEIVHIDGPDPAAEMIQALETFIEGLVSDEAQALIDTWSRVEADLSALFGGKLPGRSGLSLETFRDAAAAVAADAAEGLLEGLQALVLRSLDLMDALMGALRDALFAQVRFPFVEKLVELVAPGTHVDASFSLIDGMLLLLSVPATIGYKLIVGEAPLAKGEVVPLAFGNVTAQSGFSALNRFSWIGGLIGAFLKAGAAAYAWAQQASDDAKPSKPAMFFGVAVQGIGTAVEAMSRRTNRGDAVEAIDDTNLAISSFMSAKALVPALASLTDKYSDLESAAFQKLAKANAALDLVCTGVRTVLRTAAFGILIDEERKSENPAVRGMQTAESLLWVDNFFDYTGSMLASAAVLDDEPETKTILLGISTAEKAAAMLVDIGYVIAVQRNDQPAF